MAREDVSELLESLAPMKDPPPLDEKYAVMWFNAIVNLPSRYRVVAIQEFLHLCWTWSQIGSSTGLNIEEILSLLYKAIETLADNPEDIALTQNLIRAGFTWPERFGYILERTRTGGGPIILALDRARELMPEAHPQARPSLVDFAVGTGWFLLDDESLPIWRAVARNGEALYKRLRGFSVPIDSMKLLSGFLGTLEEAEQLDGLLEASIPSAIGKIKGPISREMLGDAMLRLSSGTITALKRRVEQNLCMDLLALNSSADRPFEYGRAIGQLTLFLGGGSAQEENLITVMELCGHTEQDKMSLKDFARMVSDRTGIEPYNKADTSILTEYLLLSKTLFESTTGNSRRILNSLGQLMDNIFSNPDPSGSINILRGQLSAGIADPGLLLAASGVLLRSVDGGSPAELLPRTGRFAQLLSLLDTGYRKHLLEEGGNQWIAPLAESSVRIMDEVTESLEKIANRELRGRFLDRVVTTLLEETISDEAVFCEFLASAVHTYGQDRTIEQLRAAETILLRKLFRAENRTRALEATMEELLTIPGIEKSRAGDLINSARDLCETLSQRAIWLEKSGDAVYSKFLSSGLTAYVRTLFEHPAAAELVTDGLAEELLSVIMPSSEAPDAQVALWQLKTASVFFGSIVPLSAEILCGQPELCIPYLRGMAALSVTSEHGEPAGYRFLRAVQPVLERWLAHEFQRKLTTEVHQQEIPEEIEPRHMLIEWRKTRNASTRILKRVIADLKGVLADKTERKMLVRVGKLLVEGLIRNGDQGVLAGEPVSKATRKEILRMRKAASGTSLIEVFREFEGDRREDGSDLPEVESFFRNIKVSPGEKACRAWRKKSFSMLENVLIDVLMLYRGRKSLAKLQTMIGDFVEIVDFLSEDGEFTPEMMFGALEHSLSAREGSGEPTLDDAARNLDRTIYKVLWRRQATTKARSMVSGLNAEKKVLKRLFDRMSTEKTTGDQILFVKRYGRMFAAIEASILQRKRAEVKAIRNVLDSVWLFNSTMRRSRSEVENIRDAVETYVQYFREMSARTGTVSAPVAGAINLGMGRRYRDNASTVAILLKWTQDHKREELLSLVEDHQILLETISRDVELIQMMDRLWSDPEARKTIKTLANHPDKLGEHLRKFTGEEGKEDSRLRYI